MFRDMIRLSWIVSFPPLWTLAARMMMSASSKTEYRRVTWTLVTASSMVSSRVSTVSFSVAKAVGIDDFHYEVLPEDKAAFIKDEHKCGRKVIMIGDGVNDSPALSEADAGIAISSGAAIAKEIADITISADDLFCLLTLKRISDSLMKRIDRNYRVIIGFNSWLMLMGAAGLITPTLSALLHNSSTILIAASSMKNYLGGEEDEQDDH